MRRILFVTGAESSGTRWIADTLSQHPDYEGTKGHRDPLENFWLGDELPKGSYVTRRSIPTGNKGDYAEYLKFEDYDRLLQADELKVIVTVRNPVANIISMKNRRQSVKGNLERAKIQYREAYKHLFRFLVENDVDYLLFPVESTSGDSVRALFKFMGLSDHPARS